MSLLEGHLRDALREVADEIPADGVPEFRPPLSVRSAASARRTSRLSFRRLAPVAAAVAVLAIAVAASVAGLQHGRSPQSVSSAGNSRVPSYYIAATGTKKPYPEHRFTAAIYATATGALLATVVPPGKRRTVIGVSAAANDRTFAVAVQALTSRTVYLASVDFYLVNFNPLSHQARLSLVRSATVPAGASYDAFALSPNGAKLAWAYEPNGHPAKITAELKIADLATSSVRTWTSSAGSVEGDTADPWSLSWAADNRTLAINWYGKPGAGPGLPPGSGLRLLDTTRPGKDLVTDSRLALPFRTVQGNTATASGYLSDVAMLTPDGRTIVAAISSFDRTKAGFAEFSAATGHRLRLLDWRPTSQTQSGGPTNVLWTSSNGSALVVYAPPGRPNRIGRWRARRLTLLPQSLRASFPAGAW